MKRFDLKRNINRAHSPFIRMISAEIIAKISGFANTESTILGRFLPAPSVVRLQRLEANCTRNTATLVINKD